MSSPSTYRSTARRARKLPEGWFGRVKVLRATSSQAHWGQGSHKLPRTPVALNTLRTDVLKKSSCTLFFLRNPIVQVILYMDFSCTNPTTVRFLIEGARASRRSVVSKTAKLGELLANEVRANLGKHASRPPAALCPLSACCSAWRGENLSESLACRSKDSRVRTRMNNNE